MSFSSSLSSIFSSKDTHLIYSPKNLTHHYKNEIGECFLDEIFITTEYKHIENLLFRFKYQSQREVGKEFLPLFEQLLNQNFPKEDLQEMIIVPIPMHWSRYFSRGFNHMSWIVKRIGKKMKLPIQNPLSVRFFTFAFRQSHLSRKKRLANKINHFRIKSHQKIPKKVFLFDDVISTGSTANECARILKNAGVKEVIGIFLASNLP